MAGREYVEQVKVQVQRLNPNALVPKYATEGAAGMDVHALIEGEAWRLLSHRTVAVPTGLAFAVPPGFELQCRPRSGLALNKGLTVLNAPGTIDSDYRGEVKVLLHNTSDNDYFIENGARIAQLVLARVPQADLTVVDQLPQTGRGTGGFGSTGIGIVVQNQWTDVIKHAFDTIQSGNKLTPEELGVLFNLRQHMFFETMAGAEHASIAELIDQLSDVIYNHERDIGDPRKPSEIIKRMYFLTSFTSIDLDEAVPSMSALLDEMRTKMKVKTYYDNLGADTSSLIKLSRWFAPYSTLKDYVERLHDAVNHTFKDHPESPELVGQVEDVVKRRFEVLYSYFDLHLRRANGAVQVWR